MHREGEAGMMVRIIGGSSNMREKTHGIYSLASQAAAMCDLALI
jgi:hypothetical protein